MKKYLFLLMLAASTAQADPFANGNAENGKKLFAKYDCNSCHKGKVGGDGSAIFTRPDRIVTQRRRTHPAHQILLRRGRTQPHPTGRTGSCGTT